MPAPSKAVPAKKQLSLPPVENLARIAMAAQTFSNATDAILRAGKADLSLSDWALLHRLSGRDGGQKMVILAVQSGVSRQRIQKQLDVLAQSGHVTVATSSDDKRGRMVTLTAAGRDALKRATESWSGKLASSELVANFKNSDGIRNRMERLAAGLIRSVREELRAIHTARRPAPSPKGGRKA